MKTRHILTLFLTALGSAALAALALAQQVTGTPGSPGATATIRGKPVWLWNLVDLERIKWEGVEAAMKEKAKRT
jgi:hypothetical protein